MSINSFLAKYGKKRFSRSWVGLWQNNWNNIGYYRSKTFRIIFIARNLDYNLLRDIFNQAFRIFNKRICYTFFQFHFKKVNSKIIFCVWIVLAIFPNWKSNNKSLFEHCKRRIDFKIGSLMP